ncbi:hypothetical protein NPX13_g2503 [Xylaria arbuscula]|uniref:Gag1-like clamp domain-containing protein n=1 Tax=Xylaria arbuscula TaxID=114810 RepID=A0A9W8TP43_9PEZI|nr:hypothetical protein NPX13_g2503 [Xylaria arbuscula]
MVPPGPVNGALIPATASRSPSPHPTCEGTQGCQTITGQQAAAVRCPSQAHDTNAALTPQATISGGHSATNPKMLFSDLYKSTKLPLSRLRQHSQQPVLVSRDYDPDLVSKDKAKQKEAVRRFLAERIRNDWTFPWPPVCEAGSPAEPKSEDAVHDIEPLPTQEPGVTEDKHTEESTAVIDEDGYHCDDDDEDAASVYSTVSEDNVHFRPRIEWLSDLSDDEAISPLAYRFETPDAVGSTVKATELARSAKRRRDARAEMEWNSGLACFTARRDAWTGAKVVRVRPKPVESTPTSPTTKRLSFWRLSSSSSPSSPTDSPAESTVGTAPLSPSGTRTKTPLDTPVQTLLPTPPPLLPAANPMRASISPANYGAIYDKIIINALTPACPINLADMLRACVVGWKRDGEWPPRAADVVPVVALRKKRRKDSTTEKSSNIGRRLSFNFLGRRLSAGSDPNAAPGSPPKHDDSGPAKGMRRSLQRVLGLAYEN